MDAQLDYEKVPWVLRDGKTRICLKSLKDLGIGCCGKHLGREFQSSESLETKNLEK